MEALTRVGASFFALFFIGRIYWDEIVKRRRGTAVRRCHHFEFLAIFAIALGLGILITAIFPVGFLMFLIAFLLIACGCASLRR